MELLQTILFLAQSSEAQEAINSSLTSQVGLAYAGIGIGLGITVLGGALGIGRIGGSAMEGIARQPEAAGEISKNMIIAAALIEGFTFFSLILAFLFAGYLPHVG